MTTPLATRVKQIFRWGAVLAIGIGYAVLSHLAAATSTPTVLSALVAVVPLIGLAVVLAWRSPHRILMLALCLAVCATLYAMQGFLVANYNWVFLLQHAGTYALLATGFGKTLFGGEVPMISRFAAIAHGGELSPRLARYTRAATWAWTLYFAGTALLSLMLFWLAPVAVWSAFANLLGMPLLALMFALEYAARCWVLPAEERAGPLEAIRAWRQSQSFSASARSASSAAHRP